MSGIKNNVLNNNKNNKNNNKNDKNNLYLNAELLFLHDMFTSPPTSPKKLQSQNSDDIYGEFAESIIAPSEDIYGDFNIPSIQLPSVKEGKIIVQDKLIFTNQFVMDCEKYFLEHVRPYSLQFNLAEISAIIKGKFDDVCAQDLIKLLEDVMILIKLLIDAQDKKSYAMSLFIFAKLRLGDKPVFNSALFSNLVGYFNELSIEMQSNDNEIPLFNTVREFLDKYSSIKNSPIVSKLYKFSMYALSLSLFSKVGIDLDKSNYSKMEKAALKAKYHMGPDFIHCLLDTILFICERGYQCYKLGSMSPLFHSEKTYAEWFDQAHKLKDQARFSHNFTLGNINEFQFRSDLDNVIEKGESIKKFAFEMDAFQKSLVMKLVNELWMIKVDLMTKRAAKESRTPPFSILLSGDSSIGKSSIMEMLYSHYGKRENLPIDCEYKYTRNAAAKFWDGFTTSQWCIIFDDVAFMNPNKAPQGDPTLMEIIQLINAVPFTPDQASLNDKGNTPVRAKLVVASTNTEDLNAHHYFACPSAVQRRFPYIVEPKVRIEFMANDGKTLDSSKCIQTAEYPDYWTFTVKKVLATPKDPQSGKHTKATMKTILDDVTLVTFLKWYNQAIIDHNTNQNTVQLSLEKVVKAVLCDKCGLPSSMCDCDVQLQSLTEGANFVLAYMMSYWCAKWSIWFVDNVLGMAYIEGFFFRTTLGQYLFGYLYNRVKGDTKRSFERISFKNLGKAMEAVVCMPRLFCYVTLWLSSLYCLYGIKDFIMRYIFDVSQEADSSEIGVAPKEDEGKRENVWYKNIYELSSFDYTSQQTSTKGTSIEQYAKRLERNLIHVKMVAPKTGKTHYTGAVCIKGNIYMLNAHALPKEDIFEMFIISQNSKDGVSANVKCIIYKHNISFQDNDVAVLEISCLPPGKDISNFFASASFTGVWNGLMISRDRDGLVHKNYSKRICKKSAVWVDNVKGEHWEYVPQTQTKNGDCGGLLIADSLNGFVIVGMHYAGVHSSFSMILSNQSAAIPITGSLCENLLKLFDKQFVSTSPSLESETAKTALVDLHNKSPIRWIEEGSCHVYGSFTGFRAQPKSTVSESIMCDYMKSKGFDLKYTKPSMKGWEPKRKALVEIMSMEHRFDVGLLDHIVEKSSKDIIEKLGDKLEMLQVYDDFTAVNGAAGVTYVDKLNRNTSMGFPWRKSKKYHMRAIPAVGGNQNPVAMSDEVMKRVSDIITKYQNGELYHPVFTAALKDEPVTHQKAKIHATRVFMGAPVDWSIVVRKYCLSFIKLIQSNRTIFECGAGTIVQSDEWHNYHTWLTHYGDDQIIAGDYSKFDKRMSAEIIRAAFKVMTNVMRASNMSDEEVDVVEGIAQDTAYPMVDYFGDLIQFNGCNPSGHPLTVIINSLANSIYMRYCYYLLNPEHEIESFQDNVHLMTYGDDNIMGVSRDIPWFNHTAIANTLDTYGVKYTMAEKEALSVPYINIKDTSFLKRKWVYCKDMERFLCPLEEDSIIKSLMIWVPSKTICAEQQSIAIMNSAVMEYFFYGKEKFEEKRKFFLDMVADLQLELYYEGNEFPTWRDLKNRYIESSKNCQRLEETSLNQSTPLTFSLLSDLFTEVNEQ